MAFVWPSFIDMPSRPESTGPLPWLERCFCRGSSNVTGTADNSSLHFLTNDPCLVTRPTHAQGLHSCNTLMGLVNSTMISACPCGGTITLLPHRTHPYSMVYSAYRLKYGCSSTSWHWCGHSLSVHWYTLKRTGSRLVHSRV